MEIILQIVGVEKAEMLLGKHRRILDVLINHMGELQTVVRLQLLRAQHTMVEEEIEGILLFRSLPDHLIIMIARYERISYLETRKRRGKTDGRLAAPVKRIELGYGAAVYLNIATLNIERMLQAIGYLRVINLYLGRINPHAVALTVMNRSILDKQFLLRSIAWFYHHSIVGTMNISKRNSAVMSRRHQSDALPLSRCAVIRQIIEHVVQPVAPHHHFPVLFALNLQRPEHLQARILVEIELGARSNGQRSRLINPDAPINHNRQRALQKLVFLHLERIEFHRIP